MRGNSHVRFLKGKAGVTPLTYLIIIIDELLKKQKSWINLM